MGLFQQSVLKKYLNEANQTEMKAAYQKLTEYFHNPVIQQNIRESKEEQWETDRKIYFYKQKKSHI